jgi:hypothetical protein
VLLNSATYPSKHVVYVAPRSILDERIGDFALIAQSRCVPAIARQKSLLRADPILDQ